MMRSLVWPCLITVALVAIAAFAEFQSQGELRRVGDLSIELKPLRPRVLVQESLVVTTILANRGSGVVTAPAAEGPSPFVYELRPTLGAQPVRIVSEQLALEATSPGTPQPDPPLPFNIGPGGSVPRRDDLAAMAVKPFAPAMYAVTVSTNYPTPLGSSSPAQVQIVPPRVIVAGAALEPSYDRRVAFANAEEDGGFGILALQSDAKRQESSVFYRASTQDPLLQPESIAVSVPTGPDVQTRWVAWTSGGTLFATSDWGIPTPQRVSLRAPLPGLKGQVLSPGYFFSDDTGLFLVLNGATLHAFRLSGNALRLAWSANIDAGIPGRVRIRYSGSAKGEGSLQLLAIIGKNERQQLLLQAWNARDGRQTVPSRAISEFLSPVVGWFLPVVGKGRGDPLQVISGPGPDGRFSCATLGLESNAARAPAVPLPKTDTPATEWAITVAGNKKVVIVARTIEGTLLSLHLPATGWQIVADKVPPGHLDAYSDYDHAWAEWLDPGYGFRRERLRTE